MAEDPEEGPEPFDCDAALEKEGAELFRELRRIYEPAEFEDYHQKGQWKDDLIKLDIQLLWDHRKGGANPNPPPLERIPVPKPPTVALMQPKIVMNGIGKLGGPAMVAAKLQAAQTAGAGKGSIFYLPLVVEGHGQVMTKVGENKYKVEAAQGLAFRSSKILSAKVQQPAPAAHAELINGIDDGDGWLKTQGRGPCPPAAQATNVGSVLAAQAAKVGSVLAKAKAITAQPAAPKDEVEDLLSKLPPAKGSLLTGKKFGEAGPKAKAKAPAGQDVSDEQFMADLLVQTEEEQICEFCVNNNLDQTWTEGLLLGIEDDQRKFVLANFTATAEMQEEATDELEKYLESKPWDNKPKAATGIARPAMAAIAGRPPAAKLPGARPVIAAAKAGNWHQSALASFVGARPGLQAAVNSQLAKAAAPAAARLPGQLVAGLPMQAGLKRPLAAVAPSTGPAAKFPKLGAPKLPAMKGTAARPTGASAARPVIAGKPAGASLGIRPKGA